MSPRLLHGRKIRLRRPTGQGAFTDPIDQELTLSGGRAGRWHLEQARGLFSDTGRAARALDRWVTRGQAPQAGAATRRQRRAAITIARDAFGNAIRGIPDSAGGRADRHLHGRAIETDPLLALRDHHPSMWPADVDLPDAPSIRLLLPQGGEPGGQEGLHPPARCQAYAAVGRRIGYRRLTARQGGPGRRGVRRPVTAWGARPHCADRWERRRSARRQNRAGIGA